MHTQQTPLLQPPVLPFLRFRQQVIPCGSSDLEVLPQKPQPTVGTSHGEGNAGAAGFSSLGAGGGEGSRFGGDGDSGDGGSGDGALLGGEGDGDGGLAGGCYASGGAACAAPEALACILACMILCISIAIVWGSNCMPAAAAAAFTCACAS